MTTSKTSKPKTHRARGGPTAKKAGAPRKKAAAPKRPRKPARPEAVLGAPAENPRAKALAARIAALALDKKALDVVVLDLRNTHAFTDFFLLCSGANSRQVHAIADAIEEALRAAKVRPNHVEGYDRGEWVLMDFFTFIVHVFTPQTRDFYSLERLWGDAERIEVTE